MARTTPFNARSFYQSHGDTGSTTLKLKAGDDSFRVRLPGIPTLTVDGIASHVGSLPDKLRVSADRVELCNGTIVATPTKGMLGADVAEFIRGVASVTEGDVVAQKPAKSK